MKQLILGLLIALVFIILTAAQGVYSGSITQTVSPFTLCFYSFLYISIVCFILTVRIEKIRLQLIKDNFMPFVKINFATVGAWLGLFIAVKYLEPAVAVIVSGAVAPAFVTLLSPLLRKNSIIYKSEKISALGFLLIFMALIFAIFGGYTAVRKENNLFEWIGIAGALVGSFSFSFYLVETKKMLEDNISILQLLSFRFILLIILSSVFMNQNDFAIILQPHYCGTILLFATLVCLLPIYLAQMCNKFLEPIVMTFVMTLEPVIAFFLQIFDPRLKVSFHSFALVILTAALSLYALTDRLRKQTNHEKLAKLELE